MEEALSDIERLRREAHRCKQLAAEAKSEMARKNFEVLGRALAELADLLNVALQKRMH